MGARTDKHMLWKIALGVGFIVLQIVLMSAQS
jgi:hypothetical protein